MGVWIMNCDVKQAYSADWLILSKWSVVWLNEWMNHLHLILTRAVVYRKSHGVWAGLIFGRYWKSSLCKNDRRLFTPFHSKSIFFFVISKFHSNRWIYANEGCGLLLAHSLPGFENWEWYWSTMYEGLGTNYVVRGTHILGTRRYAVRGTRCEVWDTRYEVRGMRYEVWGTRYEIRGMRYEIWDTRYEVRGMRHEVLR